MNKNYKVITINGIRGVIAIIFIALGLVAGFIISPGWVCMKVWNYFMSDLYALPLMNIYQGIMLWAIVALSLYLLNNKRALIGFNSFQGLSPEQIRDIMKRARESELKVLKNLEIKDIDKSEDNDNIKNKDINFSDEQEKLRR